MTNFTDTQYTNLLQTARDNNMDIQINVRFDSVDTVADRYIPELKTAIFFTPISATEAKAMHDLHNITSISAK